MPASPRSTATLVSVADSQSSSSRSSSTTASEATAALDRAGEQRRQTGRSREPHRPTTASSVQDATSSRRRETSSLRSRDETWLSTVRSDTPSRLAISALLRCSPTAPNTSSSRAGHPTTRERLPPGLCHGIQCRRRLPRRCPYRARRARQLPPLAARTTTSTGVAGSPPTSTPMIALAARRRAHTVASMNWFWIPTIAVMTSAIVGVELADGGQRARRDLQADPSAAVCAWSAAGNDDQPASALLSTVRLSDGSDAPSSHLQRRLARLAMAARPEVRRMTSGDGPQAIPAVAGGPVRLQRPWPRSSIGCLRPARTRSLSSTRSGRGRPRAVARCTRTRRRRRWPWRPATTWCWRRRPDRARASSPWLASCSPATRAVVPCGRRRSRRSSPRSSSTSSHSSGPSTSGWRPATPPSTPVRRCSSARPRSSPTRR